MVVLLDLVTVRLSGRSPWSLDPCGLGRRRRKQPHRVNEATVPGKRTKSHASDRVKTAAAGLDRSRVRLLHSQMGSAPKNESKSAKHSRLQLTRFSTHRHGRPCQIQTMASFPFLVQRHVDLFCQVPKMLTLCVSMLHAYIHTLGPQRCCTHVTSPTTTTRSRDRISTNIS
jgi:hypothetical protein